MKDKKKLSAIDIFKDELRAAFRAVSGEKEAQMQFPIMALSNMGEAFYSRINKTATIPMPDKPKKQHIKIARGEADALALWIRYHNPDLHYNFKGSERTFADKMESVRVEALGAISMDGVADNLLVRWDNNLKKSGFDKKENMGKVPSSEVAALLAYEAITGKFPEGGELLFKTLGKIMGRKIKDEILALKDNISDQQEYGKIIRRMINKLNSYQGENEKNESEDEPKASSVSGDNNSDESQEKTLTSKENPIKIEEGMTGESATPKSHTEEMAESEKKDTDLPESPQESRRNAPKQDNVVFLYKAYTTKFDKIAKAEELSDKEELQRNREQLDRKLSEMKDVTSRLAAKLQKKLLSTQVRGWDFNMEEGMLDPYKFVPIVIDASYPTPYKWERDAPYKNTVVTILIDNSGSMRGRPITIAALCADILARTLERVGVKVEILGFTTKNWKGGESRQQWLQAGSPESPGRLNDLLHIIYKDANTPWRKAKNNLGLMLREGILKENIDGEAILWAHDRLLGRSEERKILMVISDGAPVDDSTLSANPGSYLDKHLREVIKTIESKSHAELLAIGIGHDVTGHYSRAVTISNADQLGDAMVTQLSELFDEARNNSPRLRPKTR